MPSMICLYEFNEVRPLAELYSWTYIRTCEHYNTNIQVLGLDEIAITYRPQRRALMGEIVKSMIALPDVADFLDAHMPRVVRSEHREKFVHHPSK